MAYKIQVFLVLAAIPVLHSLDWPCTLETGNEFVPHKTDCRSYFVCVDGNATKMYCPSKFAYHKESQTCVPEDSTPDVNCANRPTPYEHPYCNENSTELIADPKSCARYFECGAQKSGPFDDAFLRECSYPGLWSIEESACVNSSYTGCDNRTVPIDKCEYITHQCLANRCTPCRSQFPSCKGLEDGFNAWPGRRGSSRYIICLNERFIRKGLCKRRYGKPTEFDDVSKKCVFVEAPRIAI